MTSKRLDRIVKSVAIDTCAVWNVLSSALLHRHCVSVGFDFALTNFGLYECLHKPRKADDAADKELQQRLERARQQNQFKSYSLSIEDLQEVARIEQIRKSLGKGELAAIAFARRIAIGVQTDDKKAHAVAGSVLSEDRVQTTSHVLGWLFYEGRLVDGDFSTIVEEHESMNRNERARFEAMYKEAMRCRLQARQ